jgi:hypothetical protein
MSVRAAIKFITIIADLERPSTFANVQCPFADVLLLQELSVEHGESSGVLAEILSPYFFSLRGEKSASSSPHPHHTINPVTLQRNQRDLGGSPQGTKRYRKGDVQRTAGAIAGDEAMSLMKEAASGDTDILIGKSPLFKKLRNGSYVTIMVRPTGLASTFDSRYVSLSSGFAVPPRRRRHAPYSIVSHDDSYGADKPGAGRAV